ncbi:MAG: sigma-54-dependent Fis family transcriptional regulator [Clostridia bacterium]|nr:sigma-54-dependent Fis family transcriptional regulator [Clostridia bacterium]
MAREVQVLVVDDEVEVLNFFRHLLSRRNYRVYVSESGARALELVKGSESPGSFDLALIDLKLPDMDGLFLLQQIKNIQPSCEVIIMTGYSAIRSAVQAIQMGAYDYIEKPFEIIDDLEELIERALRLEAVEAELGEIVSRFGFVVGRSAAMRNLVATAKKIAQKDITVLIQGETGTGKEVLARFIHGVSKRAHQPMVAVNCGAFTETLLESELFGHERGSFTGATGLRRGVFEMANHGTLFLDEIGAASLSIQVKLLRVLETGEFFRVGGEKPLVTDVRIIAATNTDLQDEVQAKRFRDDLFYRLDVASLYIPPLRERREDIPVLVEYFARQRRAEGPGREGQPIRFSPEAMQLMQEYDWPGNVRELANAVAQAVALSENRVIYSRHLPPKISRRKLLVPGGGGGKDYQEEETESGSGQAAEGLGQSMAPGAELGKLPREGAGETDKGATGAKDAGQAGEAQPLADSHQKALEVLDQAWQSAIKAFLGSVDLTKGFPFEQLMEKLRKAELEVGKALITQALKECMGDQRAAAQLLGISPRELRYQLRERGKERKRGGKSWNGQCGPSEPSKASSQS